ncbi:MAG: HNH endonuclease [Actinobacteria bacterium]|nr:HNH endonuclease [Actinomycetota bacterium]
MTEEWRGIPGYEGTYSVSSRGRVRRDAGGRGAQRGRILRPLPTTEARYASVNLSQGGVTRMLAIHQLVAAAFLGPCPPGMEVDHQDTDTWNNAAANLEYVTPAENVARQYRMGLGAVGAQCGSAKLNERAVREIRALAGIVPQTELARRFGVTPQTICDVLAARSWRHLLDGQEVAS